MQTAEATITHKLTTEEILNDYRLGWESRQASLTGRKEVFMGKAKFGIFGDGKEVAQLAMAKFFMPGDFRSGYYRDQTFMFAIGELTLQQYFAQLYAHPDVEVEPSTAGRSMNGHFGTRLLDEEGKWKDLASSKNSSADISPTAAQMPRLVGLAYASKLYRENPGLQHLKQFSVNGNEVAFGTIGNASTSEGIFFEAINAGGVLQIPMLVSVWDDGYGISVPAEYQTTKGSISEILAGFQRNSEGEQGYEIFRVKGWDYAALCEVYEAATRVCREQHVPVLVHVEELTQPQGHSTSGSHERYKSKERLEWEAEHDCLKKMREWILDSELATAEELDAIEAEAKETVRLARGSAWGDFTASIKADQDEALRLLDALAAASGERATELASIADELRKTVNPIRSDAVKAVRKALRYVRNERSQAKRELIGWLEQEMGENAERYNSYLYSQSDESALLVEEVKAEYDEASPVMVDGREVLQACFDAMLARDPRVFAIGEDVGYIGDVNQAFAGLQQKYGDLRVTDTGIREATIVGQGIGAALRGLRPIAEVQYLDYLLYAIQILSDDLASLQYRTKGGQKAPLIVRTRGHRLEGIWHSGSPIGMVLHSIRGMHLLVPRNMTQAAGFYNTLLKSDDPALIIECLNGYRLKERIPSNIAEFTVPLGKPEVLKEGTDITIVTYGSMCRVVMEAAKQLEEFGVSAEVIDVQTLLPFDIDHVITDSIRKTNRVLFTDEDVPGGATGFMLQQVVDEQGAWRYLDSKPQCLSAHAHRPPYSSDGDYFSKPNVEDVFEAAYEIMHEADPQAYPEIY
ncbi:pyruvate/2-oxoglutarate/acetoin dehydrogenase E1 component [Pontibacter ummariensis]|uniref:Pyruvate/2-oxoglutarate/acetoin dehydrogenase complex, dehydrogenase (E1) component n=1 Tax=Pontibacter ummariensis TaxID=1610492 RepID=A0A239JVE1_9BACT|nr:alpha-ketoacid dehydrogenase subunit alpha/beta [Pontibacter ummariensis]PRY07321.1 pyruvate/2-oxoglutarate/acetoin dehydrogenase E1 component [Pontibacter ummariensis]SNT09689.1 Pyruvate/2-oxoglutarate/acetoin dehydrogenase complex, dehydrogenase (E1) component [Pontibacter ummariensis]